MLRCFVFVLQAMGIVGDILKSHLKKFMKLYKLEGCDIF